MVVLYILFAFLLWCLVSPFYPVKPLPTPEQIEAQRLATEALTSQVESLSSSSLDIAIPTLLFIFALFCIRCALPLR